METVLFDCIIVGSGCSGVQAAQTAVEGKAKTLILDIGEQQDGFYNQKIPDLDFQTLRKQDGQQNAYFLGKDFEGVQDTWVCTKNRLTPPLKFVEKKAQQYFPTHESNRKLNFIETPAQGGLGNAWGCGTFTFSDGNLEKMGLSPDKVNAGYQKIAQRIGISGEGGGQSLRLTEGVQSAVDLDKSMAKIKQRFEQKIKPAKDDQYILERTPLAIQTEKGSTRRHEKYKDLDFWDLEKSAAYRPKITLKWLLQQSCFTYIGSQQVLHFEEKDGKVLIHTYCTKEKKNRTFTARKLILCASVLGTARIVANSFPRQKVQLPLICNPYLYIGMLNLGMLGQTNSFKKSSFSQLSLFAHSEEEEDFILANLYTYRSLLISKLIRQLPFGFTTNFKMVSIIKEMLVIAGVHLPESYQEGNQLTFYPDPFHRSSLKLKIDYKYEPERLQKAAQKVKQVIRQLYCVPVKFINPEPGSSKHYAGTLPFSTTDQPFTLSPQGRLHGTQHVYVADASGFRYLPAKGPTFTIMANADFVTKNALCYSIRL